MLKLENGEGEEEEEEEDELKYAKTKPWMTLSTLLTLLTLFQEEDLNRSHKHQLCSISVRAHVAAYSMNRL